MDFTKTEQLIIDTFGMSEKKALEYLAQNDLKKGRAWWFNKKKELRVRAREVIYQDAKEFDLKPSM